MGENPPFRPKLGNIGKECEVPGLIQMTEKCWNEQPEARPEFEDLKRQIRKMSVGRYVRPSASIAEFTFPLASLQLRSEARYYLLFVKSKV